MTVRAPVLRHAALAGIVLTVSSMLLFALMDGLSKQLMARYSFVQIMWLRYLLFVGFGLVMAWRNGFRATVATTRPALQLVRSLILIVESMAFLAAFKFLALADAHAIAAVGPLIGTVLAAVVLNETVGLRRLSAVAVGFVGVLIIIRPGAGVFDLAAAIPLFAAGLFAVYQVMTRALMRSDAAATTLFYSGVVGAVVLTVVVPFSWQAPGGGDWLLLVLVAILGTAAQWLLILALSVAQASVIQPFTYALALWAVVVGFVGFGDFPDTWTLVGGAVVIASGLYVIARERHARGAVALATGPTGR